MDQALTTTITNNTNNTGGSATVEISPHVGRRVGARRQALGVGELQDQHPEQRCGGDLPEDLAVLFEPEVARPPDLDDVVEEADAAECGGQTSTSSPEADGPTPSRPGPPDGCQSSRPRCRPGWPPRPSTACRAWSCGWAVRPHESPGRSPAELNSLISVGVSRMETISAMPTAIGTCLMSPARGALQPERPARPRWRPWPGPTSPGCSSARNNSSAASASGTWTDSEPQNPPLDRPLVHGARRPPGSDDDKSTDICARPAAVRCGRVRLSVFTEFAHLPRTAQLRLCCLTLLGPRPRPRIAGSGPLSPLAGHHRQRLYMESGLALSVIDHGHPVGAGAHLHQLPGRPGSASRRIGHLPVAPLARERLQRTARATWCSPWTAGCTNTDRPGVVRVKRGRASSSRLDVLGAHLGVRARPTVTTGRRSVPPSAHRDDGSSALSTCTQSPELLAPVRLSWSRSPRGSQTRRGARSPFQRRRPTAARSGRAAMLPVPCRHLRTRKSVSWVALGRSRVAQFVVEQPGRPPRPLTAAPLASRSLIGESSPRSR